MKCEAFQLLLEDFVDGVLDQKKSALVASHMAGCAECTRLFEFLGREQEVYAQYQREVEVTPLLWSSIEARIKQERGAQPMGTMSRLREGLAGIFAAPRLSPAFTAAMVVIAIGITVAVMSYMNRGVGRQLAVRNNNAPSETASGNEKGVTAPQPAQPNTAKDPEIATNAPPSSQQGTVGSKGSSKPVQRPPAQIAKATPEQLVREAEQKYLTAIAMLSRDVNSQRSQLDPIVLARFDASLMEIDRTIKETRRIVRENPGDPIALQYLLAAYSKKVDVLRDMTNN